MIGQQINRASGKFIIVLSLIALLAVLSGYFQPPQPDEGTAAHFCQVASVPLVPMILLRRIGCGLREVRDPWHFPSPLWWSRLQPCITLSTTTTDKLLLFSLAVPARAMWVSLCRP